MLSVLLVAVLLGFNVPPAAKVIRRWVLGLKPHPKVKEKPGIEPTALALQGEKLLTT